MKLRRFVMAGVGISALAGGLLSGAGAALGSVNGSIKIWVAINSSNNTGKILITGAVGDYGTAQPANSSGKPSRNGNYERLSLKKGTILVNSTQFNNTLNNAQPDFNPTTCSATLNATGPAQVVSGTGTYSGIKGSVTLTGEGAFIVGHKNGKCDTSSHAQPLAQFFVVSGSGNVSS